MYCDSSGCDAKISICVFEACGCGSFVAFVISAESSKRKKKKKQGIILPKLPSDFERLQFNII